MSEDDVFNSKGIFSADELFSTNNPNVFIMDYLVLLEPVKVLEGENIHNVNKNKTRYFKNLY